VPPALRKALVPVGRLDFLTEGLLLLTDDGDLAQQVAHPRYGCWKTYEVKVRGRPAEEMIERLRAGIVLEGRRTAPCRITPRDMRRLARRSAGGKRGQRSGAGDGDNSWWLVELGEGRTRQIREMFQRIGHPVQKLRRVAIGPVSDPDLPLGALRELSDREVARLRKAVPPSETGEKPAPARGGSGARAGGGTVEAGTGSRGQARTERRSGSATQARPAGGIGTQKPAARGGVGKAGPRGGAGKVGSRGRAGPRSAAGRAGSRDQPGPRGGAGRADSRGKAGKPGPRGGAGKAGARGGTGKPGPRGGIGKAGPRSGAGKPGRRSAAGKAGSRGNTGRAGARGGPRGTAPRRGGR
jgi:23S rRNA pseudouridine2605 synthase